jgi:hypothetical protein
MVTANEPVLFPSSVSQSLMPSEIVPGPVTVADLPTTNGLPAPTFATRAPAGPGTGAASAQPSGVIGMPWHFGSPLP